MISTHFGAGPRDLVVDAAADPVRRACSTATTPASRRPAAYPIWIGHPQPGPVPLPRHRQAGVPPAVCTGNYGSGANAEKANDQNIYTAAVVIPNR